ncbi:LysR family transcriptional regulator [Actinosynnema sp. ALI-1.44]|uniref:LysR family transcriptional regulator n=1 Tax=Actinosynnema sp. ALI-1.44 TaxID=1933779 RepID=UPI00097BAD9C|nr:LysR family transcriptional regulator [Actinosynnema sp. ALI-1.44]ONI88934.1 LysR family transcriptional regulator [Actinosynnema sp. ALI-1.44]
METRQLETFVTVAEELSFTRAAQRLHAVQSTVSAAIKALEAELGTKLFDRSTRRVTLSAAGAAFLPEAKAALEAVDRAMAAAQEASAGLRGTIRVGTMTNITVFDLPELLGSFHRHYPLVDIHVTVSATGSSGMADDVRTGRLDLALLGLPESDLAGLTVRPLANWPYTVLLPHDHPLAGRAGVALADLAHESFVDTPSGFGNRVAIDRAYVALGSPRRVGVEVADLLAVSSYIRAGLGIAVIPDPGMPIGTGVVRVPLSDGMTWPMTMVTAAGKPPSRALRTLLDLIASDF